VTKGQRFDAPYLRKPLLPWSMGAIHTRGVTVQLRRLLRHQLDDVELFLGDTGGVEYPVLRSPPL
jgi:hypothetical protein